MSSINKEKLRSDIEELSSICQKLDPFAPIDFKMKKELQKWGLDQEDDPFVITNKLILKLETALLKAKQEKLQ